MAFLPALAGITSRFGQKSRQSREQAKYRRGKLDGFGRQIHGQSPPFKWEGAAGTRNRRRWGSPASWSQMTPCGTPDDRFGTPAGRAIFATWDFSAREERGGREIGLARATGRHL